MKRWNVCAAALLLLAGVGCGALGSGLRVGPAVSAAAQAGEGAITAEGLLRDISELASDR